jgi:hypothetical protein
MLHYNEERPHYTVIKVSVKTYIMVRWVKESKIGLGYAACRTLSVIYALTKNLSPT